MQKLLCVFRLVERHKSNVRERERGTKTERQRERKKERETEREREFGGWLMKGGIQSLGSE